MVKRIKGFDFERDARMRALGYGGFTEEKPEEKESDIIVALREICDKLNLKFDNYFKPNYEECTKENFKEFCLVVANAIKVAENN